MEITGSRPPYRGCHLCHKIGHRKQACPLLQKRKRVEHPRFAQPTPTHKPPSQKPSTQKPSTQKPSTQKPSDPLKKAFGRRQPYQERFTQHQFS